MLIAFSIDVNGVSSIALLFDRVNAFDANRTVDLVIVTAS
jgi:hypothetical protein